MDTRQVSLQEVTRRALPLLAAALVLTAAGCGRRPVGKSPSIGQAIKKEVLGKKGGKDEDAQPMTVTGSKSAFTVDNKAGQRVLQAKLTDMQGSVKPGVGIDGPVHMKGVDALLFDKGQPSMNMLTPTATWDGTLLVADQSAHGVSADKKTVMDAHRTVWTAKANIIDMVDSKVQGMKDGKTDFTAEGPQAHIEDRWVTMNSGARSHNEDGQNMTADHMRWNLDTGKLLADGNVVVTEEGTRISGPRLNADTKLRKGHFTGRTRVWMKSSRNLPGPGKAGAPPASAKKTR